MIVETQHGPVEGREQDGVASFLGVPYAAPVTIENRFDAPQEPTPWSAPRPATELGGVCPQLPTYGPVGRGATSRIAHASDFLTVNVRTPSVSGRAPVLVWLHGGGYAVGSANEPQLQTGAFAASGIVEVTVNYRLGALGFAHLPGKPDNRGLLDQIAALLWVRRNIAAFGGDPERVVLSGRSAGGFAVSTLLAMPASFGLYERVLAQSGAGDAVVDAATASRVTERLAEAAGTDVAGLEILPIDDLLRAQVAICDESYDHHDAGRDGRVTMIGIPFQPVIDGDSLPLHPETAAAQGLTAPVPLLSGCTTAEYWTHSSVLPDDIGFDEVVRLVHERVVPRGLTGEEIVRRYRKALPLHSPAGIWRAVCGDLVFQLPARRLATAHAAHRPSRFYLFGEIAADEAGSPHGAEVPLIWHRDGYAPETLPARARVSDVAAAARAHRIWVSMITDALDDMTLPSYGDEGAPVLSVTPDGERRVGPDPWAARTRLWAPLPT